MSPVILLAIGSLSGVLIYTLLTPLIYRFHLWYLMRNIDKFLKQKANEYENNKKKK